MLYKILISIIKPFFYIYFNIKVINRPKKIEKKRMILAGNHSSWIDPFFFAIAYKRQISFLAKEELFKWWPIRKLLLAIGMYPVNRGSPDRKAISFALKVLENDNCLGIFPEGTRNKESLGEGHNGTSYFAYKTGADILPIVIYNKSNKFRSKVIIKFGELIEVDKAKRIKKSELNSLTEILMQEIEKGLIEVEKNRN
ncbi:MAG: lysophospholipid acyltransferase family protein [Clostridia bacterium]